MLHHVFTFWVVWECACSYDYLTKQHCSLRIWRAEAVEIQIRKLPIQTSSAAATPSPPLKFWIFDCQAEGGVVMVTLKTSMISTSKEAMAEKSITTYCTVTKKLLDPDHWDEFLIMIFLMNSYETLLLIAISKKKRWVKRTKPSNRHIWGQIRAWDMDSLASGAHLLSIQFDVM